MYRKLINTYTFLALIAVILITASCKHDLEKIRQTEEYKPTIETGKDIEMIYSEQGIVRIKLTAPKLVRHSEEDTYVEFPLGLQILFYNDSLEVTSTLKANYGIRYEKKQETLFRDKVEIINKKGEQLYTEELIWNEKEALIQSDKFVRIITPNERIKGRGFTAKQDFTNYKITNITEGIINVETGENDEGL